MIPSPVWVTCRLVIGPYFQTSTGKTRECEDKVRKCDFERLKTSPSATFGKLKPVFEKSKSEITDPNPEVAEGDRSKVTPMGGRPFFCSLTNWTLLIVPISWQGSLRLDRSLSFGTSRSVGAWGTVSARDSVLYDMLETPSGFLQRRKPTAILAMRSH